MVVVTVLSALLNLNKKILVTTCSEVSQDLSLFKLRFYQPVPLSFILVQSLEKYLHVLNFPKAITI